VEKAKLQAALDRTNGERARLAYELAKTKQQTERTRTTFVRQCAQGLVDRPELKRIGGFEMERATWAKLVRQGKVQ
jgi:hypothetical protein